MTSPNRRRDSHWPQDEEEDDTPPDNIPPDLKRVIRPVNSHAVIRKEVKDGGFDPHSCMIEALALKDVINNEFELLLEILPCFKDQAILAGMRIMRWLKKLNWLLEEMEREPKGVSFVNKGRGHYPYVHKTLVLYLRLGLVRHVNLGWLTIGRIEDYRGVLDLEWRKIRLLKRKGLL